MKILIAGASGFIGTILVNHLSQSHQIAVLGRQLEKLESIFSKDIVKITWDKLEFHDPKQYDLLINLSGASIGDKRWNSEVKRELIESRIRTNQQIVSFRHACVTEIF